MACVMTPLQPVVLTMLCAKACARALAVTGLHMDCWMVVVRLAVAPVEIWVLAFDTAEAAAVLVATNWLKRAV